MRTFISSLMALATAIPAGVAAVDGPKGENLAAPAAAIAPGPAGLPDSSRFIYGTPDEEYPVYGGVPKEFWPFGDRPYYRFFVTRMPFRGPGRNYPPPAGLKSLRVGLIDSPRYSPDWDRSERTRAGIVQAIEEANAARRPDELPFELVEHEGIAQWGGAANLAALLADESVLGYLGMIDGTDAHVALRVTLKTEIVMINTSDPDPTLTETQIPWLLRVLPDQRQELSKLADLVVHRYGCKRIAILRAGDRFARVGSHMFIDFVRRLGCPAAQELLFAPGSTDISYQLAAIKQAEPEAIFFLGDPADLGRFVRQFREAGVKARFFGTNLMMEESFRRNAGDAAEGVMFTSLFDPARPDPLWTGFAARFQQRWGRAPDVYAAYAYDGAQILLSAIRRAGPNRWQIRDLVCNIDYYHGVTGWMRIDGTGSNIAPVRLVRLEHGQPVFEPEPEFAPTIAQR
ncbi:MAG TPA: ABC transporter substrate-binding protein [Lacunisphaera sp.]|jgi:branched-chain amino acid transport system substrate-binding protein|nr:ABC transporter substrate-binding protein [Lacunisphaera sp.]